MIVVRCSRAYEILDYNGDSQIRKAPVMLQVTEHMGAIAASWGLSARIWKYEGALESERRVGIGYVGVSQLRFEPS